jgi:hypothetical protein
MNSIFKSWLVATALLIVGLLHSAVAPAQQLVLCNTVTTSPCNTSSNPGSGSQGDPAWVAFGKINANFDLIPSTLFNGQPLPILSGGTGQTTATGAINALLPSQSGNAGNCLGTDGTVATWVACGTGGGGGGSAAFSALTSSTNTSAAMVIGSGASLSVTGSGTNQATSLTALTGMPSQAAGTVVANITGGPAVPIAVTLAAFQGALTAANSNIVTDNPAAGPINDYAPSGFGISTALLYITPASGGTILDGLLAGSSMQQVFVVNAEAAGGADNIYLMNQSASDTTAANLFLTSATSSLAIPPGGRVDCIYLAGSINFWHCQ